VRARLAGSRKDQMVDFILELPPTRQGDTHKLELVSVRLDPPKGPVNEALWQAARRGWFNI
jgi:hypothetical protein